nr:MAG TPA: hypothetical protein [Caudoviricetes sp.]
MRTLKCILETNKTLVLILMNWAMSMVGVLVTKLEKRFVLMHGIAIRGMVFFDMVDKRKELSCGRFGVLSLVAL